MLVVSVFLVDDKYDLTSHKIFVRAIDSSYSW